MNSIITVGITGGIGTGKSTICRIISIMGYPVFYSDKEASFLLETNNDVITQVKVLLGSQAYTSSGKPDRSFIASSVFENQHLLQQLNAIIHPAVRQRFESWKFEQKSNVIFNEAAILFETGAYKNFDKTILVTAPDSIKIKRVKERDKISEEQVKSRIANQWPDETKIKLADYVIVNDDTSLVLPQLISILEKLK